MCGIAGIVAKNKVSKLDCRIGKMCISMNHRGPNASGHIRIGDNVALAHTRLSIIDLNHSANQPMLDEGGRYYLIFNGEIVNYKEIKKLLDYPFKTKSDTEVILAGIVTKGLQWTLDHLEGMFAFALFDTLTHHITLVRDHLGIKPLYYAVQDDCLVFASDIKTILESGLIDVKECQGAVDEYLSVRYVREPYTFFDRIMQVPHGSSCSFDGDLNIDCNQYYHIPRLNFDDDYNENEITGQLHSLLQNTLDKWLESDVKVGSYLSGGVDSSLLTAMMADKINNLDTYTIGFDDEATNEFSYAQMVAQKYQTNHHEFLVSMDEYSAEENQLIYLKGAPLGVPNESLLSIMTSRLSKDVTVVISGEGADELFGGYGRIFRSAYDYKSCKGPSDFYEYFINKYEYIPRKLRDKYIQKSGRSLRMSFDEQIKNEFKNFSDEENIFRYFHNYHIQGLLQRLDNCTMKASVESRPPFLDHVLLDYVYTQIPYGLKLHWNSQNSLPIDSTSASYSEVLDTPKYILKKVAEQYLPKEVIYRRKQGFPVPLTSNLDHLISMSASLKQSPWLSNIENDQFLRDIAQYKNSGQILWMFLSLEKFRSLFFERTWRY